MDLPGKDHHVDSDTVACAAAFNKYFNKGRPPARLWVVGGSSHEDAAPPANRARVKRPKIKESKWHEDMDNNRLVLALALRLAWQRLFSPCSNTAASDC